MLSAWLLALLMFAPAGADHERLTPAARAATRARLAGTAAVAPAAWNQIMGPGDISADPDTATIADLATSEILLQASPATVWGESRCRTNAPSLVSPFSTASRGR